MAAFQRSLSLVDLFEKKLARLETIWKTLLLLYLLFFWEGERAQGNNVQGTRERHHPSRNLEICKEVEEVGIAKQAESMYILKTVLKVCKPLDYRACLAGYVNALMFVRKQHRQLANSMDLKTSQTCKGVPLMSL